MNWNHCSRVALLAALLLVATAVPVAAVSVDAEQAPSEAEVREWLEGNLCRCTGYYKIIDAIQNANRVGVESEES